MSRSGHQGKAPSVLDDVANIGSSNNDGNVKKDQMNPPPSGFYEAQIPPTVAGDKELTIDLNSVPVHVDTVKFEGLRRTKNDYVEKAIKDVFTAQNFGDLILKVGEAQKLLRSLEAFSEVGTMVDISKLPTSSQDSYEVTFLLEELKWIKGGMKLMAGSNDVNYSFGSRMPNLLGRGEKITVDWSKSQFYEVNSEISFSKPFPYNRNANISASLFYSNIPHALSGFNCSSTGSTLRYSFLTKYLDNCQLEWQGAWRQLTIVDGIKTSFTVRENIGHSIKSALRFVYRSDKRDHPIFPSIGYLLKSSVELAGLMGDARFWKQDFELQHYKPLFRGITLQSSFRGGFLHPLCSSRTSCNISDYFFLGGPHTLRGFAMRGVGPRSGENALGGKAFWSAALHAYSPLPYTSGSKLNLSEIVKTHVFVNAGNLAESVLDRRFLDARISYGAGLVFRVGGFARVELNYCWPWRYRKGDRLVPGIQMGVGIDFL